MTTEQILCNLSVLRNGIVTHEKKLRNLRTRRNELALQLANAGVPERTVGHYAGTSGPYINQLKRRQRESQVKR